MNSLLIRQIIVKLIKNHWLILSIIIGLQYVTGKFMAGKLPQISSIVTYQTASAIHNLLGLLIGITTLALVISKIYLQYVQHQARKKSASNAA